MGYIYKITNKINNKCYIGQTMLNLSVRWKQHNRISSNCIYLKRAFDKHGINNFKFDLICICFDNDLNKYEVEYMDKYNSLVPNGYNLRHGGNNGELHQLTKDKIKNSLKEYYKINKSKQYGKPGIIPSEETKKKISNSLKGRKMSNEAIEKLRLKNIKKVIQYNLNGQITNIYNSGLIAADKNNTSNAGISMVCNKKRKQLKGFKYEYENSNITNLFNELLNLNK